MRGAQSVRVTRQARQLEWFVAWGVALLWAILSGATPAAAQGGPVLPIILSAEQGVERASPWWTRGDRRLTSVEQSLVDTLAGLQVPMIDPATLSNPPKVSRIYRVAQLSRSNAVNLAGLYGASRLLIGQVVARDLESSPMTGRAGAEWAATLQVVEIPSGRALLEVSLARQAWGQDVASARASARERLMGDVSSWLARSLQALQAPVGVPRAEPYVLVRGLTDRAAMRATRRALAEVEGVESVVVGWLIEGGVAFDLNPEQEDSAAAVTSAVEALRRRPPEGMIVSAPVSIPGAGAVAVEVRSAAADTEGPEP